MSTKQSRKTARRKARQEEALARFKERHPNAAVVWTRFNAPVELQLGMMRPRAKQSLMEGYKQDFRW